MHLVSLAGLLERLSCCSGVAGLGLLFCLLCVPETRYATLDQIQSHFSRGHGIKSLFANIQTDEQKAGPVPGQETEGHI